MCVSGQIGAILRYLNVYDLEGMRDCVKKGDMVRCWFSRIVVAVMHRCYCRLMIICVCVVTPGGGQQKFLHAVIPRSIRPK